MKLTSFILAILVVTSSAFSSQVSTSTATPEFKKYQYPLVPATGCTGHYCATAGPGNTRLCGEDPHGCESCGSGNKCCAYCTTWTKEHPPGRNLCTDAYCATAGPGGSRLCGMSNDGCDSGMSNDKCFGYCSRWQKKYPPGTCSDNYCATGIDGGPLCGTNPHGCQTCSFQDKCCDYCTKWQKLAVLTCDTSSTGELQRERLAQHTAAVTAWNSSLADFETKEAKGICTDYYCATAYDGTPLCGTDPHGCETCTSGDKCCDYCTKWQLRARKVCPTDGSDGLVNWFNPVEDLETVGSAIVAAASEVAGTVVDVAIAIGNTVGCIVKGNNVLVCECKGVWHLLDGLMKGMMCDELAAGSVAMEASCNLELDAETEGTGALLCIALNAVFVGACNMMANRATTVVDAIYTLATGSTAEDYACSRVA